VVESTLVAVTRSVLLMTDPLETALWIDALADRVVDEGVIRTDHHDLVDYLQRFRTRARA